MKKEELFKNRNGQAQIGEDLLSPKKDGREGKFLGIRWVVARGGQFSFDTHYLSLGAGKILIARDCAMFFMLWIQSFNVKEGRLKEFQKWIKDNEKDWAGRLPPDWSYRGTYFYVLGFGRYGAASILECSKYSDFDTWRNHADQVFISFQEKFSDFTVPNEGEAVLLREVGDTKIVEPPKKP